MFGVSKIFSNAIFSNAIKNINLRQSFVGHYLNPNPSFGLSQVRHYSDGQSKFDQQFIIVRITPKDFEAVIELCRYAFFNGEPTMVAAGLSYRYNPMAEVKFLESMTQGMSLMAKCRRTGTIVGASLNSGLCPWDPDLQDHFANTCTCHKLAEVMRFYSHVTRLPNLFEKFHEFKIFEVTYLATDFHNQGKGIGYHLVKRSLALAKDLTYTLVRVDATSLFTQKICSKLKMAMVYELPFKSYVNCDGKPVFLPPPPHTSVQVFVELPHTSSEQRQKLLAK